MLLSTVVRAQQAPAPVPLQATLDQAAASGTFTFVVFHRDGGDAGRTLTQQVAAEVQSHAEKATVATARVDDPAEKALVEKFGIARAPMPMVVVVAPNGAVTGLFPRAISTFRTCPLKYKFRYVDGLPEESVSSALVFGTGIHTAIEQHFQAILSGEEQPDIERLMFAYRSAWLPHDPDAIQFGSTETRASLDALASKMLTAFLSSPAASVQGRVLGVEEEIRGMLVENVPDLYGRVDLLTEDSDSLTITDIKTSRGKWSQEQVEDSGEQLLLYSHLASEISPGKKIATRFLVLTKTKEPVVEEHVREVEPGNVKRTLAGVERVWRAIESGVFYPAPSTMSCAGCGYRVACRAWAG